MRSISMVDAFGHAWRHHHFLKTKRFCLNEAAKISTTVVFGMLMKHGKISGILSKHVMPHKLKSSLSKD